ncbi:hypothetical protein COCVIDRAFT_27833 [Bipolaris victoriae FI3]|uniref:Uncharacterized protein n=1 Tax=Bipolaris victoriae (strain FI3) TaxID=930091 RepID=W7EMS4_BIPV3|nr:hypothetical protein COCVIDRAFT_27833 [Bipolaris victoriae FI3]
METDVLDALESFQMMLRDEKFIEDLQKNASSSLPTDCKAVLVELVCAFIPDIMDHDPPRKKSKARHLYKRGSWSSSVKKVNKEDRKSPFITILRLQELILSPAIQTHIENNKADAHSFFYSKEVMNNIQSYDKDSTGEALILQYQYTKTLSHNMKLNSVRWHFLMLMWHDIVKLARPDCTGNRISHLMKKHLLELITPVYANSSDMNAVGMEVVADELHTWCRYGAKLNVFVENFGEGCIFYLQGVLSPNFLSDKMTASGTYYDEAMTHLRETLHLTQILESNPLIVRLSQNIRRHLLRPFEESKMARNM